MRFETVPPIGQGALVIKHDISLDRLFRFSYYLKVADVQPGEIFRIIKTPCELSGAVSRRLRIRMGI